jgi:hypothetical protein
MMDLNNTPRINYAHRKWLGSTPYGVIGLYLFGSMIWEGSYNWGSAAIAIAFISFSIYSLYKLMSVQSNSKMKLMD